MSVTAQTGKEIVFLQCAHMILDDQCPPDRKHYLCMKQEDDTGDCMLCWNNFLSGLAMGDIDPYKLERDITKVRT